jgi:hypothetical protein
MSDRAALRSALLDRVASRTDATVAKLDKWLNDGLLDLGTRRIHIRELETVGTPVSSSVGTAAYSLDSGDDSFYIRYIEDTTNLRVLDRWPGTFQSYLKAKQNEAPTVDTVPTFFLEHGNQFFVFNTPQVATINWTPYIYVRSSMGVASNAVPNINEEWHYGIEILAAAHAFKDVGDEERAIAAEVEWNAWLAQRDTARRGSKRFNIPVRGIQPHGSWIRRRRGI